MSASSNPAARPPRPRRRLLNWLLLGAFACFQVLLLLVLLAPLLVNPFVRPRVVAALNGQLAAEVRIETLQFSWWDGLTIEGVSVGNPAGFAHGVAASIGRITANPSLLSLLSGELVFENDLRVENVRFNIEQNTKGEINLAKLTKAAPVKAGPSVAQAAVPAPQVDDSAFPFIKGGLILSDLVVALKTPALAAPVALSPIHGETRIDGLDKPLAFALGNKDASLSVKGSVQLAARPTAVLEYTITPAFLTPIKPALSSLGPVKKFDGTLSGKGRLALGDPKQTSGQADLTLAITVLELDAPPTVHRLQPGETKLTCSFQPGDGKAGFTATLTAPATTLTLKGTTDGASFDGALSAETDLAELSRRLPGVIPVEAKLQGRVSLGAPQIQVDAKTMRTELEIRAEGLSSGGMATIKEFDTKLRLAADLPGQTFGIEAGLDLAKLRDVAITLGAFTPATELSGNAKLTANVALQDAGFPFQASLEAAGLHFKGPQTSGVPVDEPRPVVRLAGVFTGDPAGPSVTFSEGSTVAMDMMRGTVKGKLMQSPEKGLVADNLVLDVTYDPLKFNPLLAAFKAGQIVATGPQQVQIRLNGPLQPGEDTPEWLRMMQTASSLGFTAYRNTGFTIEGLPFAARLTDGQMPIDYACKINRGPFSAKGNVRLLGPASDLSIKLDGMDLNYEMAPWLGFLNPLMGAGKSGSPALSGQVNAQFNGRWDGALVEKPDPKAAPPDYLALATSRLSGRGQFSVANFKSSGSPLMMALSSVIGGSGDQIGEIQPTSFSIAGGALHYDSMVVILAGQRFAFTGVIRFDQRMDMQVTMPFPSRLIKDRRLAKYLTTVTVPLTGTIAEPKLDSQAVLQLALKNATNAALKDGIGGALDKKMGEGAGNLLKGLFGGKK